ncbi:MAG TPA: MFS transporter [Methanomassiliicoccales archaeon]|nr:MFS transporter [Methanomassiliicoccales archaeon]
MDSRRLAMFCGGYIGPLSSNAVLAMVPVLKAEFGAGAEEVLLAVTFYMLPFALFNLVSGTVSDIHGRRKVLAFGFLLYALSNVLCALSPNLLAFYLCRSMQGIGYAFVNPVLMAVLGDITPTEERGRTMGYFGAFTTAGIATGPMIAGFLIPYGWRWTFVLVAALALGVDVWIRAVCPAVQPDTEAFRHLEENMGAAVRTRGVAALCLMGFLTFLCYMGALGFLSDHLSLPPLSLEERTIGVMVGMSGVAGIVAAPIGGRLVDARGRTRTAVIGFLVMALALAFLYLSRGALQFALSLLVLGTGTAFIWTALLTLAVEIVPKLKGTVSSIFNSARFFGYSLAPLLFAPIYSFQGFGTVLLVGLGLTALALLVVRLLAAQLSPSHSASTRSS